MKQVELSFEPGLTEQFPRFEDCVRASVYSCGRAFKAIAADMDMSVSELSRKLADNPNDPVHFPLPRLPELIAATGDKRPIFWLIESFLEDPEQRKARVLDRAEKLIPELASVLKELKGSSVIAGGKAA